MKAKTRLYCNCGWERWFEFDDSLTDEETMPQSKAIIEKHMAEVHGQFDDLRIEHRGKTRIKPIEV